jgi:superfamily II DNA or RNA helicase
MALLILENTKCRLEESDSDILRIIDSKLSFEPPNNVAFTDVYSGNIVYKHQTQHLLSEDDYSCFLGFKNKILNIYKSLGKEISIIDNRTNKSISNEININEVLDSLNMQPRYYQIGAVDVIQKEERGILRMATGSGKTLTSALMIAKLGKKSNLYVIGTDLLHQTYSFFKKVFPNNNVGIVGDGYCDVGDINVVSIWTVGKAIGLKSSEIFTDPDNEKEKELAKDKKIKIIELLNKTKVHIFDECHVCSCSTIQGIFEHIDQEHVYGMSASPWRDDGTELFIEGYLGNRIYELSASELIEKGYLVQPTIKFIKVPMANWNLSKNYRSVYEEYIVNNEVRNGLILKAVVKLVELGYVPLVLFNSIKHGDILYELISSKVSCSILSGKDKSSDREKVKTDIAKGNIKVILASKIFDIGLDLPVLSGLVIAGGGKSSVRALQRIGRVIRKAPGKKSAAIIDFDDNATFLREHSWKRRSIYSTEEKFIIK